MGHLPSISPPRLALILGLFVAFALGSNAGAQVHSAVRFEKNSFFIFGNTSFKSKVLIDPVPTQRLLSYGLLAQISSAGGIVGTAELAAVKRFNFNGPLDIPALTTDAIGSAGIKATVDFFDRAVPLQGLRDKTLAVFTLQPLPPGDYTITLQPYRSLGEAEHLFIGRDLSVADPQIEFGTAELHVAEAVGTVRALGAVTRNGPVGTLQQKVRLTNTSARTLTGVRLLIDALPATFSVWNAFGQAYGRSYIESGQSVPAGQFVDLTVQFRSNNRTAVPRPKYVMEEARPLVLPPLNSTAPIQPTLKTQTNGLAILEFSTVAGTVYYVQYSSDMLTWKTAQPSVMGTGAKAQWLDTGPPRTDSKPSRGATRFYRIVTPE